MEKVETIYFDWGGVLISNPAAGIVEYCSKTLDCEQADYLQAYRDVEFLFYRGKISEQQLWQQICDKLSVPLPRTESLWADAFGSAYEPIEEMFELIQLLKRRGIKIGLLSNTEPPCKAFTTEKRYDCFDHFVFSFELGIAKPEPEIFTYAAELSRTPIQNILFVDDKSENTVAAQNAGMQTFTFDKVPDFKKLVAPLI